MAVKRTLFGTDGIRGRANVHPMTPEVAMRVGMAVSAHFGRHGRVVVGKDTRRSGYMFEMALASGLCALGSEVMLLGPLPTPAIAHITCSMRADAGVVISASHNAFEDNGIKIFAADGFKLPDAVEAHLESLMSPGVLEDKLSRGDGIGRARRIDDAVGRYITHVKHAFPAEHRLDGLRIVVDCAHGAAYKIAPAVMSELGADVVAIGVSPNGTNINDGVGATQPDTLIDAVRKYRADIGVALDGDADRAVFCDADGRLVDGDQVLAIVARDWVRSGVMPPTSPVVATVLSNMGLERSLESSGIPLIRTPVGDRYVVEAMRANGSVLGGEQSGHTVCLQHSTTGDGVIAALQILAVMVKQEKSLAELAKVMTRYPQVSKSIAIGRKVPLEQVPRLQQEIESVESELGQEGRVVVRYSGTEPKIRVMIEGDDLDKIEERASRIGQIAAKELADPQ